MLKKLVFTTATVALLLIPLAGKAQMTPLTDMPSGTYILDKTHASLVWKVSHLGLSDYTARFTSLDAKLEFDAKDPAKSGLEAMVDPLSIETDYPNATQKDFDKELAQEKEWFNASKHPTIRFVSTSIEKTGENTGKIHGNLTFLGVTKPLALHATFNGAYLKKPFADVPALGFSATATLKRSEWGFSTYVPHIGNEVQLLIETEFHKVQ